MPALPVRASCACTILPSGNCLLTRAFALPVLVKWGKEQYEVELNVADGMDTFRAQLFALTMVAPDRQKLMLKGKQIKVVVSNKKKKKRRRKKNQRARERECRVLQRIQ
jgi:hypothetical protein